METRPLRGRGQELDAITAQLDLLLDGRGSVTIVEGPAGAGKSRLLEEAAAVGCRLGARVGWGAAARGDRVVPLHPLLEALADGVAPPLEIRELSSLQALPERRYWLIQRIQGLLELTAATAPVVVILDDLQWADAGTVAGLEALSGGLAGLPIAWLVAVRSTEVSGELEAALRRLGMRVGTASGSGRSQPERSRSW